MNALQLAVCGGHTELICDLVDTFHASIDFAVNVSCKQI